MKSLFHILCLVSLLGLSACAAQPQVMGYFPEEESDDGEYKVWPAHPQVPRYRYAGQLLGEDNFSASEQSQISKTEKVFNWLVGLVKRSKQPRQLSRPQNGMVGPFGRIYITDVGNQSIFVFDESAGKLLIWENADQNSNFISPIGILARSSNEILVSDSVLGRIVRLDLTGNPVGSFGADDLLRPTGLAIDRDSGQIYVADTGDHNIKVFDHSGVLVNTIGEHGADPGQFNAPTYLSFSQGQLYVSDTLNARVQVLTKAGEAVRSIGQRGLYIGNFTRPKGITSDTEGNIYVVESYYDHVLIFNAEGDYLLPIGGTGKEAGHFFLPAGIWSDKQNRIFTADMLNSRVFIMQYLGD